MIPCGISGSCFLFPAVKIFKIAGDNFDKVTAVTGGPRFTTWCIYCSVTLCRASQCFHGV